MNPSRRTPIIGDVSEFDCTVTDASWPWAERNAESIAAHWQKAQAQKPELFDGQVLVATEVGIERSRLVSRHAVVPYSALLYWKQSGFREAGAFNLFGSGVVVTADGAVLLGLMAAHTANAGHVYFPCGTPDLDDVEGGKLDVEGSILRELAEETGLKPGQLRASDDRWISWDGPLFCCARRYDTALTEAEVEAITSAHLASQERPELEKVLLLRSLNQAAGLDVPAYAEALLRQVLV